MSFTDSLPNHLTGSRRLTLTMLTARDRADSFAGLPAGSAKPLRLLAAFQEAEPYLGLPAHAFKLVSWLIKQTMPCDWEEGSRPIVWPSARRQQEYLDLSAARVKMLNRVLFEAGIFVIRDNEQGKRYGRRGPDGRIIEAYGFDLTPLAQRYDEFVRIAAEAKAERERKKALRKRATIARRAIRQVGEALEALGPLPPDWKRLVSETADFGRRSRSRSSRQNPRRISAGRPADISRGWCARTSAASCIWNVACGRCVRRVTARRHAGWRTEGGRRVQLPCPLPVEASLSWCLLRQGRFEIFWKRKKFHRPLGLIVPLPFAATP
jgi:Replication protein C N-terminal domain